MSNKEQLYNLLKETFLLLDDGDRRLFGRYNLTPSRFYALVHISEDPGISSSKLSHRMLCDKSNVTRIVKGLEANGYLRRKRHETDGRAMRLYLTEKGKSVCHTVHTAHKAYNKTRLNCINDIAQGNLLDNLLILNQSLQDNLTHQAQFDNNGKLS